MRTNMVNTVSRLVLALAITAIGCSRNGEDCNYIETCGRVDTGGATADAGHTGGGGVGGTTTTGTSSVGGVVGTGGVANGGTGTGGVTSACSPTCTGSKPLCVEPTKTCVECLSDGNCAAPKPGCNLGTNACVQCTKGEHCSGTTPVCDIARNVCVGCLSNDNCSDVTPACNTNTNVCVQCTDKSACGGTTPLCDTTNNVCVECLTSADCKSPTASACVAGTCEPCTTNTDCSHISGKGVCKSSTTTDGDAGVDADTDAGTTPGASECVQCTGTDYAACGQSGGKNLVCNTLSNTCSTFTERSAGLCKTCVSDAQCPLGEMCVEEMFNGQSVGYFCFYKQGDTANGAPASCFTNGRPYSGVLKGAISIDGQTADICSLRVSTCTALNQFSQTDCTSNTNTPNDQACGFAPGMDSKCAESSTPGVYACTTTCGSDIDCKTGFSCNTGVNPNVCAFQ